LKKFGHGHFWIGLIHNGNIWKWDYSKTPMLFNGFRDCYNKDPDCSSVFNDAKFGHTYAYMNAAADWQWDDQDQSQNYKEYPICQMTSSSRRSTPTMTTTRTPSTTSTTGSSSISIPWECQSDSYNILNDTNRKSNNNDSMHDEYCDKSSHSFASPDWKGESWYRIMPPAGTQLADSLGPDHIQVKCS